jgi:Na+/glutamate symporter
MKLKLVKNRCIQDQWQRQKKIDEFRLKQINRNIFVFNLIITLEFIAIATLIAWSIVGWF